MRTTTRLAVAATLILQTHVVAFAYAQQQPTAAPLPAAPLLAAAASGATSCTAPTGAPCCCAPATSGKPPLLDTIEQFLRIGAFLVGGAWVYFNYFKGRTHKPRLEVHVAGKRLAPEGGATVPLLLLVSTSVKNVGLSKIELLESGSGLRVFGYNSAKSVDQWEHITTLDSLASEHTWIEPNVAIAGEALLPIRSELYAAFKLELVLNSGKVRWKSVAVV